jgi:hypothetical protein
VTPDTLVAQATNTPTNGASRAEDFQPQTRNPQPTNGSLQTGGGPQSVGGPDILSNPEARIVVPTGASDGVLAKTTTKDAGINWFMIILVVIAVAAAAKYFSWLKKQPSSVQEPIQEKLPAESPEAIETPAPEQSTSPAMSEAKPPVSTQPKPVKKTTGKKKSKSKRKKSRK